MPVSLDTQIRIAELREKAKSPAGLSTEDCKEAIAFLRAERMAMTPTKSSTRKSAAPVNADDLLGELGL